MSDRFRKMNAARQMSRLYHAGMMNLKMNEKFRVPKCPARAPRSTPCRMKIPMMATMMMLIFMMTSTFRTRKRSRGSYRVLIKALRQFAESPCSGKRCTARYEPEPQRRRCAQRQGLPSAAEDQVLEHRWARGFYAACRWEAKGP